MGGCDFGEPASWALLRMGSRMQLDHWRLFSWCRCRGVCRWLFCYDSGLHPSQRVVAVLLVYLMGPFDHVAACAVSTTCRVQFALPPFCWPSRVFHVLVWHGVSVLLSASCWCTTLEVFVASKGTWPAVGLKRTLHCKVGTVEPGCVVQAPAGCAGIPCCVRACRKDGSMSWVWVIR